jgi:hypothetical protein
MSESQHTSADRNWRGCLLMGGIVLSLTIEAYAAFAWPVAFQIFTSLLLAGFAVVAILRRLSYARRP